MQHLAQEIPKLPIVRNREDIGGVCVCDRSAHTLFIYSFPNHLSLSDVKGRILCWMDFSSDQGRQFLCVWVVEWGVAANLHLPGCEDPKHDFTSCLNLHGCSASSIILFPQILLTAEVQCRRRGQSAASSRTVYFYVFMYLCWLGWRFFFLPSY